MVVFTVVTGCAGSVTSQRVPLVVVDSAVVATTRDDACQRLNHKSVSDHDAGARHAGMLPGDYEAIKRVSGKMQIIATFRDSNPACLPHLAAGVQSSHMRFFRKAGTRATSVLRTWIWLA